MKIPILHLSDGIHKFDFTIPAGALHFYREEVYPNPISAKIELNKFEKNITCVVDLSTKAQYICDRCLSEYSRNYDEQFKILFHLGKQDFETEEESVVMLSPEQREIDLTPHVHEYLILTIPMKTVCSDTCKGICPGCGADLNKEECSCEEQGSDPRWDKLKELRR